MDTIRHLNLGGNYLTGPLSTELGRLTRLSSLSLYDNSLTGSPIPQQIMQLSELSEIDLHENVSRAACGFLFVQETMLVLVMDINLLTYCIYFGVI